MINVRARQFLNLQGLLALLSLGFAGGYAGAQAHAPGSRGREPLAERAQEASDPLCVDQPKLNQIMQFVAEVCADDSSGRKPHERRKVQRDCLKAVAKQIPWKEPNLWNFANRFCTFYSVNEAPPPDGVLSATIDLLISKGSQVQSRYNHCLIMGQYAFGEGLQAKIQECYKSASTIDLRIDCIRKAYLSQNF